MLSMFECAYQFNQPIGNWNVMKVANMDRMFYKAVSFEQSIEKWMFVSIRSISDMFESKDKEIRMLGHAINIIL